MRIESAALRNAASASLTDTGTLTIKSIASAVLARIAEHPGSRLDDLLPWNWSGPVQRSEVA